LTSGRRAFAHSHGNSGPTDMTIKLGGAIREILACAKPKDIALIIAAGSTQWK